MDTQRLGGLAGIVAGVAAGAGGRTMAACDRRRACTWRTHSPGTEGERQALDRAAGAARASALTPATALAYKHGRRS